MPHRWLKGLLAASAITLAAAVTFGAKEPASLQGDNPPAGAIRVDRLDVGDVPVRRPGADPARGQAAGQQTPQTPTFRSAVELIPVNVSVLGRDGRPVVDLKKETSPSSRMASRRRSTLFAREHRCRNLQGERERGCRAPDCPGSRAGTPGAASFPHRPLHVAWQQHPGSEQGARRAAGIREQAAAAAGRGRRHGVQPRHGVHNQPRGDRRRDRALSGAERQDRGSTGSVLLGPSCGVR